MPGNDLLLVAKSFFRIEIASWQLEEVRVRPDIAS